MGNAKWGLKRTCQSCSAHFYDMCRTPIVCPKCGEKFDPDAFMKMKRSRTLADSPDVAKKADFEEGLEPDLMDVDAPLEDAELLEDPEDLEVGDEDVTEVIEEHVEMEEDR